MATDAPAARWPHYREDDCIIRNFVFKSGEMLPELRLHDRTMGLPRRDASGTIVNGVRLLQGNTGTGAIKARAQSKARRWRTAIAST
jgi:homoserine O-acetyltransferase